jgi:hypothetical protein
MRLMTTTALRRRMRPIVVDDLEADPSGLRGLPMAGPDREAWTSPRCIRPRSISLKLSTMT